MPKANSRQVQWPRIPARDYDYATWTVTRLRQELYKYDVQPGSWIKKSGLESLLKTTIKQHHDWDEAPQLNIEEGHMVGGPVQQTRTSGMRTNLRMEYALILFPSLKTSAWAWPSLLRQSPGSRAPSRCSTPPSSNKRLQPSHVMSSAGPLRITLLSLGTHPWCRMQGIPHLRLMSRRTLCLILDPGPRCHQGFSQPFHGSRAQLTPLVRRNRVH